MNRSLDFSFEKAIQYFHDGLLEKSVFYLDVFLLKNPNHFDALLMRGVVYGLMGNHTEARLNFEWAIQINPRNNFANFNLAKNLSDQGCNLEALNYCERAIELAPNHKEAWLLCGKISYNIKKLPKAITCYERALKLDPRYIEAMINKAACLIELNDRESAFPFLESALELGRSIQLTNAEVWSALGSLYYSLLKMDQSIYCFDIVLNLDPGHLNGWISKGRILLQLGWYKEAIECYQQALAIDDKCIEAAYQIGEALIDMKDYDESVKFLQKRVESLDSKLLNGSLRINKNRICDWDNYQSVLSDLADEIESSTLEMAPFAILHFSDSPQFQLRAAELWNIREGKNENEYCKAHDLSNVKIKVGYFSPDFSSHAVANLSAGLFELHSRNLFEIYGFSLRKTTEKDEMRERLIKGFDYFYELDGLSAAAINELVKKINIDIAIDLAGHTRLARTEIFQGRLAPIQVNYLGYPGTMGGKAYDYIIGDKIIIPEDAKQFYSEKVVYLPDCFQVNDSKKTISQKTLTRADYGLPADGFIYCCHNASQKINPPIFESWMRILNRTENSYLWLLGGNDSVIRNLKNFAAMKGVATHRIIFANRVAQDEYLSRYGLADIFLDTLPFNAGTTASDALWGGLPVLTQSGRSFAGRMATSILHNIGLPELVASNQDEYELIAVDFCRNPFKLKLIRDRLVANKTTMPLFNTERFARNIERAYLLMYARHVANLPPDHLYVE